MQVVSIEHVMRLFESNLFQSKDVIGGSWFKFFDFELVRAVFSTSFPAAMMAVLEFVKLLLLM